MDDLVELGRTGGAYGFRGWVRIAPIASGEVLDAVRDWILVDAAGRRTPVHVTDLRLHGAGFIAKWDGCESKEAADAVRAKIMVPRSAFPDAGEDEAWAVDVIGCEAVNKEGVVLGRVEDIGTNGVQDLFVIGYEGEDGKAKRFMVPDVKDVYVIEIDVEAKRVTLDWDPDWR